MEEVTFIKAERGNDIIVINKYGRYEVGIIHRSGNKYLIDNDDRSYSHLTNAIENLVNNKCLEN